MKRFTLCFIAVLIFLSMGVTCLASSMPYVGNKSTKVYHISECTYAGKISTKNVIYFRSSSVAEANGYRSCYYCGDGVVEPGHSGGGGSGSGPNSGYSNSGSSNNQSNGENTERGESGSFPFFWIVVGSAALLVIAAYGIRSMIQEIQRIKINKKVLVRLGLEDLSLPRSIVLTDEYTVSMGKPFENAPYGTLTVYCSNRGRKFHKKRGCCKAWNIHFMYEVPTSFRPCRRCAKGAPEQIVIPDWYKQYATAVSNAAQRKSQFKNVTNGSSNFGG